MHVIEFAQTYDGVGNAKPRAGITDEKGRSSQQLWEGFCTQKGPADRNLDGLTLEMLLNSQRHIKMSQKNLVYIQEEKKI